MEEQVKNDGKSVVQSIFLILLLLMVFAMGVVIYYLYNQGGSDMKTLREENGLLRNRLAKLEGKEPEVVVKEIYKDRPVTAVRDIKKPKKELLFSCYDFQNGSYKSDRRCQGLAKGVNSEYDIYEVRGVVDEVPYMGSSPELKQEGLASYRAKEGAKLVEGKTGKESIILQGFSVQEAKKRGVEVYGYKYE